LGKSKGDILGVYIIEVASRVGWNEVEAVSRGAVFATIRDNPAPFDMPSLRSGYSGCCLLKLVKISDISPNPHGFARMS
jgi:hypothetical protein